MSQTNGWTEQRRQTQSELIRTWKPWQKSTGPRTPEGKAKVAQNSFKGGIRPLQRKIAETLRKHRRSLAELSTKDFDTMATKVVTAAFDGHHWAIQEIARVIDE